MATRTAPTATGIITERENAQVAVTAADARGRGPELELG